MKKINNTFCLLLIFSQIAFSEDNQMYLITNSSAGYFKIGEKWQDIAKNVYKYDFFFSEGRFIDDCSDGAAFLGNDIGTEKDKDKHKNIDIMIGAVQVDESISEKRLKKRKDVFFISSPNCSFWYWKDKVDYIVVFSDKYKTKEGISVGTTLRTLAQKLRNVKIEIGWLEEDPDAVRAVSAQYPNVAFILSPEDAIGGYERLEEFAGSEAKVSVFKKDAKILRIIIYSTSLLSK